MKEKNISVFGDSLVYGMGDNIDGGWVTRVKHKIKGGNNFFNFGIPGDTSQDLLKRIDEELEMSNPDLIIVFVGANDSQYKKTPEDTLISKEQYKQNLEKIIKKTKEYSNKIIFVGLPRMDDKITTNWNYIYYFCNDNLEKYDKTIKEVCAENNFEYIPLNNLINTSDLSDGAHPNPQGYEKIANKIYNFLSKNYI